MKPMKNFLLGNGVIKMARWAVVKDSMRCHEGEIRLPEEQQNVVEDMIFLVLVM